MTPMVINHATNLTYQGSPYMFFFYHIVLFLKLIFHKAFILSAIVGTFVDIVGGTIVDDRVM